MMLVGNIANTQINALQEIKKRKPKYVNYCFIQFKSLLCIDNIAMGNVWFAFAKRKALKKSSKKLELISKIFWTWKPVPNIEPATTNIDFGFSFFSVDQHETADSALFWSFECFNVFFLVLLLLLLSNVRYFTNCFPMTYPNDTHTTPNFFCPKIPPPPATFESFFSISFYLIEFPFCFFYSIVFFASIGIWIIR